MVSHRSLLYPVVRYGSNNYFTLLGQPFKILIGHKKQIIILQAVKVIRLVIRAWLADGWLATEASYTLW